MCIVDDSSVITEDEGIYRALSGKINVLKIKPGHVLLPGFKNGFLGGASGLVSKNKLAFCGNIKLHPDFFAIKNFIEERNIDIILLSSTDLCDFGSILHFSK